MKKKNAGFTLIELIIVVVIVAILATAAYTAYNRHVQSTQRANAEAALTELANFMERHYSTNSTYAEATLPFTVTPRGASGSEIRYKITLSIDDKGQTYTLTATPANAQTADSCGELTLDQTGATTAQDADCW